MKFQIRDIIGNKIFERSNAAEICHHLRDQDPSQLEIWVTDSKPPYDLIGIYSVEEFWLVTETLKPELKKHP